MRGKLLGAATKPLTYFVRKVRERLMFLLVEALPAGGVNTQ